MKTSTISFLWASDGAFLNDSTVKSWFFIFFSGFLVFGFSFFFSGFLVSGFSAFFFQKVEKSGVEMSDFGTN